MPERFKKSVSEMVELRNQNIIQNILFVTWNERIKPDSELREFLETSDVTLIEKEEAPVGGKGNIWHQMRALNFGVKKTPSNHRILKTRTDTHIDKHYLRKLLTGDVQRAKTEAGSHVLSERIWTPYFVINEPFHLSDFCFYGKKEDINKLINFDVRYDILYHVEFSIHEVRRFIHPYLGRFSFLRKFLERYDHVEYESDNRRDLLLSRIESPVYTDYFAFYYTVLMNDFYFEYEPVTFRNRDIDTKPTGATVNRDLDIIENFNEVSEDQRSYIVCSDTNWLASQLSKSDESVPDSLASSLARSLDDWKDYTISQDSIEEDEKRDQQYYSMTGNEIEYPNNIVVRNINRHVLRPMNMTDTLKKMYRRLYQ